VNVVASDTSVSVSLVVFAPSFTFVSSIERRFSPFIVVVGMMLGCTVCKRLLFQRRRRHCAKCNFSWWSSRSFLQSCTACRRHARTAAIRHAGRNYRYRSNHNGGTKKATFPPVYFWNTVYTYTVYGYLYVYVFDVFDVSSFSKYTLCINESTSNKGDDDDD
jgi:hypothetical protein